MLSEHLTARQIEELKARAASPSDLLSAMNHLASCKPCREQLSSERKTRAGVESLQSDLRRQHARHLSYEEMAACVDDSLSPADRVVLESHAEICSSCAVELADLRAFKAEMTTYPEIERSTASAPTFRQKIIAFLSADKYRLPVQLATAATVLLLCVVVAALLMRKEAAAPQIAEVQHQDEASQEPVKVPATPPAAPNSEAPTAEIAEAIQDGGGVVTMDKGGNVAGIESLSPAYQRYVETALKSRRVETPSQLQELIGKTGVLMGGANAGPEFKLIGPVGTLTRTDRPSFRWQSLQGATSYVVAVYDSNFNRVASSETQPGTAWSPAVSLKRGETYSWQVTAIKDGKELVSPAPPAPDAKFRVLDAAKTKELEQAKRMYPDSHLLLGILYERAGLLDDAEIEFRAVNATNPKSQTTRKLLNDLKSLRRAK